MHKLAFESEGMDLVEYNKDEGMDKAKFTQSQTRTRG